MKVIFFMNVNIWHPGDQLAIKDNDPISLYLSRFKKSLRIKDPVTREQMINEIEQRAHLVITREKDPNKIDEVLGDPVELARYLSDPDNWSIDLGHPLSPNSQIKSYISTRGRIMLMSFFFLSMIICGAFVVTGDLPLQFPVIFVVVITLWAIMAAWFNQYLGYIGTVKELSASNMKISGMDHEGIKRSVMGHYGLLMLLAILTATVPLILDMEGALASMGSALSVMIGSTVMAIMITKESGKVMAKDY